MAEITVAALKAATWRFTMHADGSDKRGRFSISFYECDDFPIVVKGWRKTWRDGTERAGYAVEGEPYETLAEVAALLNQRFTAGDDKEAAPD